MTLLKQQHFLGQLEQDKQHLSPFLPAQDNPVLCAEPAPPNPYCELPMRGVPSDILTGLKPHYSSYIRVPVSSARYWHTGFDLHADKQLYCVNKNSTQRISTALQSQSADTYAFIKKPPVSVSTQAVTGAPAKPTSAMFKSDAAAVAAGALPKEHIENQPKNADTIAPSVIISQPKDAQTLVLKQSAQTKKRFAHHVMRPGETVESVVDLYTGTLDTGRIYGFNYPQITAKKPPKPGDTIKVHTGYDVLVKGQFYNSHSVEVSWQGPTSGTLHAELERIEGEYQPDTGYEYTLALPLIEGQYQLTANADGASHRIQFSVVESNEQQQIVDIIYIPADHSFVAVTQSLADILDAQRAELNPLIENLKQCIAGQSQDVVGQGPSESLVKAKEELNSALKPLVSGPSANSITEVIGYKGNKYTYVRSDKVANHTRKYKIKTDIRDGRRFSNDKGELDKDKLAQALKNDLSKLKTSFKFDHKLLDDYTAVWGDWAKELNKNLSIKGFEKSDYFDASADARLMRYTHGASIAAAFNPKDGVFALQGDFKSDFAVGEAKAELSGYLPSKRGYEMTFMMPLKNSIQEREVNLGAMRLGATVSVFGYAGAKLQASVNLGCSLKQGKMMVNGLSEQEKKQMRKADRMFEPVKGGAEAFVGVSGGCELAGALQWDNPEKKKRPAFCDLAKIGGKAQGSLGAGAQWGFYIGYEDGKFKIQAKASLVWGVGAGGELVCEVGVDELLTLVQFVYHQLKNEDYDYLTFIQPLAFKVLYKAVMLQIYTGKNAVEFLYRSSLQVDMAWRNQIVQHVKVKKLANQIIAKPEVLKFTPPEAKGAFLNALANSNLASYFDTDSYSWSGFNEQRENAILVILKHILCRHELNKVLRHMGEGGTNCSKQEGLDQLNSILDFSQQTQFDAWQRQLPFSAKEGSVEVAMVKSEPFSATA
ncbi:hypothetical protein [Pseudoalteromonas luteoviolacea]|uniref:LysM domain-containing protein n=1 Tax=Pseudoalteromonas luteoviolacea H33 TaxID=1365251 RepID=A0A167FV91_9GAMM|nr:hypothetical protein [Pseudoalteromonas luteoviolacea]KZN53026.1 hypothetical protein N476_09580 [Pseudoalteromonas luteoviolacea H33]KZN78057.1 hypothetical protein N477_10485 [Pseudoalteromonas luteoviolacea H33-S]MBQ4875687.1 hypothetical protein [Pseudoalteromonas luteoviolacea]MBQ4904722.1 hypothetical protein [Pseudoalteromonas luteoviolacea]